MEKEFWGKSPTGQDISKYTIRTKSGSYFVTMDFGGTLLELHVPDRDGKLSDVVLGFQDLEAYFVNEPGFGCLISPYANRVGGAKFELNGKTYQLEVNDNRNCLHSGSHPLHRKMWDVVASDDHSITYSVHKEDMECGFPGNVDLTVTYSLSDDNRLDIHYHAVSDQDTYLNLTNHSYFNLGGHDSGSVLDQKVWIDADAFTPTDAELIPTGEIAPVDNTPMDLRTPRTLRAGFTNYEYEPIRFGHGYDHNYVLKTTPGQVSLVGSLEDEKTGRLMEIYTDMPGMQIYSGNYLTPSPLGKGGFPYQPGYGVAFETQYFPDAVNQPSFPQPLVKAGEPFDSTTSYYFKTVE